MAIAAAALLVALAGSARGEPKPPPIVCAPWDQYCVSSPRTTWLPLFIQAAPWGAGDGRADTDELVRDRAQR